MINSHSKWKNLAMIENATIGYISIIIPNPGIRKTQVSIC